MNHIHPPTDRYRPLNRRDSETPMRVIDTANDAHKIRYLCRFDQPEHRLPPTLVHGDGGSSDTFRDNSQ
ncbi:MULTISPECIES: hypothetical protein [unclassified Pseudomonas]|uniref:hypothetical protein n=1 Tax=unclassified Pseudomonas TaxID=196821 RepID=UPI002AC8AC09|nr:MULTISPECIES: hypothetical protein [unclassified Pseudomonas]MEB0047773.1 hypothetical protein [Pseudomonas sp. Dout3]MEB0098264.1 hypothetical protein [Pseudomonas sp. DC1.2]WPX59221.1 hypothetical protein RHM68_00745 [Pseudomonas sp. DC1.2]